MHPICVRLVASLVLLAAATAWAEVPSDGPRVVAAREHKQARVRELLAAAGVAYPAHQLYLRAFKHEAVLEVWAANRGQPLALVSSYPICAASGELGPKRRRGDLQVPEGFYQATQFSAVSNYHLSLLLDYPNASDRVLGYQPDLGGSILIHGDCVTIGCIPIENDPVEELYLMAYDTHLAGRPVVIHVFPTRMDEAGMQLLRAQAGEDLSLWSFWESMRPVYERFEATRRLPRIEVDPATGRYVVRS